MYRVGFAGTRAGMTTAQYDTLDSLLREIRLAHKGEVWLHHGDCVGSDETAHRIAKNRGFYVCIHPPILAKYRAFVDIRIEDKIVPPKDYLERNQDIVDICDFLIATPASTTERLRGSGTWATIFMTRRANKPHSIIFQDGSLE